MFNKYFIVVTIKWGQSNGDGSQMIRSGNQAVCLVDRRFPMEFGKGFLFMIIFSTDWAKVSFVRSKVYLYYERKVLLLLMKAIFATTKRYLCYSLSPRVFDF